jgi:serine protease Do/serine protease DegQ
LLPALLIADPVCAGVPVEIPMPQQELPSLAPVLRNITPAVVSIGVQGRRRLPSDSLLENPDFRDYFNLPDNLAEHVFRAAGSGVIVDAGKGYVLTNLHVIENAADIAITLQDGRQLRAGQLGADPRTDIALLQVPAGDLQSASFGDSDRLQVGDFVLAVGNPFGLGQTVTSGVVSALSRSGLGNGGYENFIQTDASINPGNSGGALIDMNGTLIGINTAIIGPAGGSIGIGFAIPANMAHTVMLQLLTTAAEPRGQLGMTIRDLTEELAAALDIDTSQGVLIDSVFADSPAARAGLRSGDVIIAVDGVAIHDSLELENTIDLAPVGKSVRLRVLREGTKRTVNATPEPWQSAPAGPVDAGQRLQGARFGALAKGSALHGHAEGVAVLQIAPGSPPWRAGLREGDVIASVNRLTVHTPAELSAAARQNSEPLLLNVLRGEGALFIVID